MNFSKQSNFNFFELMTIIFRRWYKNNKHFQKNMKVFIVVVSPSITKKIKYCIKKLFIIIFL